MKLSYFFITALTAFIAGNAHHAWSNDAYHLTTGTHMIVFLIFILTGMAMGVLGSVALIETVQDQDKE